MADNKDFFRAGVRAAIRKIGARQEGLIPMGGRDNWRTVGEELREVNAGRWDDEMPTAEALDKAKASAEASGRSIYYFSQISSFHDEDPDGFECYILEQMVSRQLWDDLTLREIVKDDLKENIRRELEAKEFVIEVEPTVKECTRFDCPSCKRAAANRAVHVLVETEVGR